MIGRFFDILLVCLASVVGVLLLFLMVSISADVVGRYFLGHPVGWAVEFAEHILMAIPFLGMAWLAPKLNGHVRVDVVLRVLSNKLQAIIDTVTSLICGGVCGFCAFWAIWATWDNYERSTMTVGIYPIPKFILIAVIAFGFSLTTIVFFRIFAQRLRSLILGSYIEASGQDPV